MYELLSAGEMRRKYGLVAENAPTIRLDSEIVPPSLRHLIPLAEKFGIADDLMRADLLAKTDENELKALSIAVFEIEDEFDKWLAGPEARNEQHTPEYTAFTCLRMAADGF